MDHQDWTTVVLRPKKSLPPPSTTRKATTLTPSQKPAWKIEQQVDADGGKPLTMVSSETAKAIVGGRVARKLTRQQLATRLNLQEREIADIETCKAVENKALIAKIKRFLQI
jgi:ribosome-binding protein aMBF1 (putative translation factor)